MLVNNKSENFPPNIWVKEDQKQRRKAILIQSVMKKQSVVTILDIGCAAGYISETAVRTIGVQLDPQNLDLAKQRVQKTDFLTTSIEYDPFRNSSLDISELPEHLPGNIQQLGLKESVRLRNKEAL